MREPAMLADHIDRLADEILEVWRAAVDRSGDVPEAEKLSRDEFNDHVPEILDRLAERLRGHSGDTTRSAQKHGAVRWRQGYDVADVIKEIGHLRVTLSRATVDFARNSGWDLDQLETANEAIHGVLDDVAAESVRQFQEDSRKETAEALGEVKKRQAAVEDAWYAAKVEQTKLQTILASLPVPVWVADAEGRLIGANAEAEKLQGFPRTENDPGASPPSLKMDHVTLRPDGTVCPNEELALNLALRGETIKQREYIWSADGEQRPVSVNAAPLIDARGAIIGAVAAVLDVTERKRLEASLEQQRQLAEASSLHKTRLVATLSHDARTPLNAVVLAAQLLEFHFDGSSDDEVQSCLHTIRHSVRNVLDLLGDLLDLTKLDAGVLPPELSRFPLDLVLTECVASIETQAAVKGLDVHLDPGPFSGMSVETDRSKLKQILANLLSNALRYTKSGRIRVYGERFPDGIRISVEDTGVGIDAADQQHIFEEFAMLRNADRAPGEGSGLGLAISLRLARLLKGDITVRSVPGSGSTFTLTLPNTLLALGPAAPANPLFNDPPPSGSILIAEDHEDSRKTLAKVLRRMGYRALEAGNGREALDLVRQERPFVVLMDINMPVMDGIEATLTLRADPRYRDLPIFALTGDVTLDNQQRIGEAGVNGYLEKPVTWEALRQALATLSSRA